MAVAVTGAWALVLPSTAGAGTGRDVTGLGGGPGGARVIALTFDDGPTPAVTPRVLDLLAQRGMKATFFVLGSLAERHPDLLRRMVREGHAVAGHTWTHRNLIGLDEATFTAEVDRTNATITAITGQAVRCVRPPGGRLDATVVQRLEARGLTTAMWDVDPKDWTRPGAGAIRDRVVGGLRPGAVVLLHDFADAGQTLEALPPILDAVAAGGWTTVPICGGGTAATAVRPAVAGFGRAWSAPVANVVSSAPVVGAALTPSGKGYWLAGADGGVFAFGDAPFLGSAAGRPLAAPIVAMASTPSGKGYWLAGADGGVFAFGDAPFSGGLSGTPLRQPVVGIAPSARGRGYWLAAGDGGVFAFGGARYKGSPAGPLVAPVAGIASTPSGRGYWLVGADGAVFAFGAPFHGGANGLALAAPVVGIANAPGSTGYRLVAADGGVFTFGPAHYLGSTPADVPSRRTTAIASVRRGYLTVSATPA